MSVSKQQNPDKSSQAGFSIIEVLLAIIIVTILMAAIAPAIVLSVATRIQAKRIELGTAAAKSYIDGVRSGAIAPPLITNTPANDVEVPSVGDLGACTSTDTPVKKAFYCPTGTTNSYLYCIDNDNIPGNADTQGCKPNSFQDMIVQAYGLSSDTSAANEEKAEKGYKLGIRVYRADAFAGSGTLKKSEGNAKRSASTFTGGNGDSKAPLIEMTTEIATPKTKYSDLCDRLGGCS